MTGARSLSRSTPTVRILLNDSSLRETGDWRVSEDERTLGLLLSLITLRIREGVSSLPASGGLARQQAVRVRVYPTLGVE
jgi:hypothetical protein